MFIYFFKVFPGVKLPLLIPLVSSCDEDVFRVHVCHTDSAESRNCVNVFCVTTVRTIFLKWRTS